MLYKGIKMCILTNEQRNYLSTQQYELLKFKTERSKPNFLWGKLMGEVPELYEAVTYDPDNLEEVAGEIADVYMLVEVLKLIYRTPKILVATKELTVQDKIIKVISDMSEIQEVEGKLTKRNLQKKYGYTNDEFAGIVLWKVEVIASELTERYKKIPGFKAILSDALKYKMERLQKSYH